jgi:hypothetical protein
MMLHITCHLGREASLQVLANQSDRSLARHNIPYARGKPKGDSRHRSTYPTDYKHVSGFYRMESLPLGQENNANILILQPILTLWNPKDHAGNSRLPSYGHVAENSNPLRKRGVRAEQARENLASAQRRNDE